jgi:hypothetical protein
MLASNSFTVDSSDQAKVLTIRFSYRAQTNPGNANWSGTSANSFSFAIWDVTNSAWIIPAGAFGMTQSSGVGIATGTFQTSSNGTQYRLVVYNSAATTGAVTVYFDDFSVGPQTAPIGVPATDWVSYTPTFVGFGTPSAVQFYSRRVGDSLEVRGTFAAGTTTNVPQEIGLGFNGGSRNVTVDTTKSGTTQVVGTVGGSPASTTLFGFSVLSPPSDATFVRMGVQTSTTSLTVAQNASAVASVGQGFQLWFKVPIVGWSSNVQMSNDTDTRVVSFTGTSTANTLFTGTTITMAYTPIVDTHAAFSGGNTYTVPVSGFYKVIADTVIYQNSVGGGNSFLSVFVNGTSVKNNYIAMPTQNAAQVQSSVYEAFMSAGTTVQIRMQNSSGNMQILGSTVGAAHYFSITRLSGPSVIAATESVRAIYQTAAGQSIPNNTATTVVFGTRIRDTHNSMNAATGVYTCPASGGYRVSASLYWGTAITAIATDVQIQIFKNGVLYLGNNNPKSGTGAVPITASGSFPVDCNAGDTIEVRALQNTGSAQTLLTNAVYNWVSIERVGN